MPTSSNESDSHLRSVVKGLSYRLIGTAFTTAMSFVMTGSVRTAALIGTAEVTTKVLLFWGHERVWQRISWGRRARPKSAGPGEGRSETRREPARAPAEQVPPPAPAKAAASHGAHHGA